MGCGRVGATVARALDRHGDSVSIIDVEPEAFRRLGPQFGGRTIQGVGFDRDVLVKAGIRKAQGFAALSSGDNSNIVAARVVREEFGLDNVMARISDAGRAQVYETLGIPTVATVRWAAAQTISRLVPEIKMPQWTETAASSLRPPREPLKHHTHRADGSMRVAIVGAGNVGRAIASELAGNGHEVLLIERDPHAIQSEAVPEAQWLLADGCELDSLDEADLATCDVCVAATGDDKANLVHSLLAKREFGVPRTVARINHPSNEWLFTDKWGVDVAVSTPSIMSSLIEEAVGVGDVVRLLTFKQGNTNLVELTLPDDSPAIGARFSELALPGDGVIVAVVRDDKAHPPQGDEIVEAGDELFFLISASSEDTLMRTLAPREIIED